MELAGKLKGVLLVLVAGMILGALDVVVIAFSGQKVTYYTISPGNETDGAASSAIMWGLMPTIYIIGVAVATLVGFVTVLFSGF